MEAVIITLLILLVFLLSCDSHLLQTIKNTVWSSAPPPEGFEYSLDDELMIEDNTPTVKGENFMNSREPTNTWEPSTTDFAKAGADKIFKAYSEDLKANVDSAIVESHREYTEDTDFLATTGASHASATDHDDSAVPWVGFGGRRGGDVVHDGVEDSARTTTSYTPEQVSELQRQQKKGLTFN